MCFDISAVQETAGCWRSVGLSSFDSILKYSVNLLAVTGESDYWEANKFIVWTRPVGIIEEHNGSCGDSGKTTVADAATR